MKKTKWLFVSSMISVVAIFLMLSPHRLSSQQGAVVRVDGDDIGGVVTGANGPEAGVWVIAETTGPPDQVRQDRGHRRSGPLRDCPTCRRPITACGCAATGLVDSPKVQTAPGKTLNLKAVTAPNDAAAAEYYPADLLVFDAQDSRQERIPRHRARRQRHRRRT